MRLHQLPFFIPSLYPNRIWKGPSLEQKIMLTFDDGPVPGITDWVLEELEKRGMKATFFMVGDNARKHPALARAVVAAGHQVGNHTCHHLVLSYDFDANVSPEILIRACASRTAPGTIVVFHDQQKTQAQLKKVLPDYLDFLVGEGYITQLLEG